MVKPRYINHGVIVPKPGPKILKDNSFFIGHVPYEGDTTDVQVKIKEDIEQPHLDRSEVVDTEWSNLFKDE